MAQWSNSKILDLELNNTINGWLENDSVVVIIQHLLEYLVDTVVKMPAVAKLRRLQYKRLILQALVKAYYQTAKPTYRNT